MNSGHLIGKEYLSRISIVVSVSIIPRIKVGYIITHIDDVEYSEYIDGRIKKYENNTNSYHLAALNTISHLSIYNPLEPINTITVYDIFSKRRKTI